MAIFQQGVFSIGGGTSGKPVPLLSITNAPSAPFEKGSKYYNSSDQKIYTAVEDDTWEDAKVSDPSWGTYYLYDGHAYVWDGNSLEYFELNDYQQTKDKTDSYTSNSKTTYPNSYALKEGLARKQDTLVSGTNIKTINDNSILGSGNLAIETHQDFPAGWTTDGTFAEFLTDIFNDESAVPGMSYLGTLRCSEGLPESFNNVEAVIEVQQGPNSKTLHVTITSGNVAPYRWEYTSWNSGHSNSGWISFQLPLTAGENIDITNNVISATDTTYTAGTGIDITNNIISSTTSIPDQTAHTGEFLTTNGSTLSWARVNVSAPSTTWYTNNTGTTITILDTTDYNFVEVYKNGLLLEYGQDYTISGTTLTLVSVLVNDDKIAVKVNDLSSVQLDGIEALLHSLNSGDN